jgi:hypothetical protein
MSWFQLYSISYTTGLITQKREAHNFLDKRFWIAFYAICFLWSELSVGRGSCSSQEMSTHFTSISGLGGYILSTNIKIVVPYCLCDMFSLEWDIRRAGFPAPARRWAAPQSGQSCACCCSPPWKACSMNVLKSKNREEGTMWEIQGPKWSTFLHIFVSKKNCSWNWDTFLHKRRRKLSSLKSVSTKKLLASLCWLSFAMQTYLLTKFLANTKIIVKFQVIQEVFKKTIFSQ